MYILFDKPQFHGACTSQDIAVITVTCAHLVVSLTKFTAAGVYIIVKYNY